MINNMSYLESLAEVCKQIIEHVPLPLCDPLAFTASIDILSSRHVTLIFVRTSLRIFVRIYVRILIRIFATIVKLLLPSPTLSELPIFLCTFVGMILRDPRVDPFVAIRVFSSPSDLVVVFGFRHNAPNVVRVILKEIIIANVTSAARGSWGASSDKDDTSALE